MKRSLWAMALTLLVPLFGFARDPLRQPFHHESIWNMPIGSEAEYVHAGILAATQRGMTVDEDLIVLTPAAPMLDIYRNDAGWNRHRSRCTIDGGGCSTPRSPATSLSVPTRWDWKRSRPGFSRRPFRITAPISWMTPHGTSMRSSRSGDRPDA